MAEESNDLQPFQSYKITPKVPVSINTKCVDECDSDIDKLNITVDNVKISELSLVDINGEDGESIWLAEGISTNEGTENEWLEGKLDLTGVTFEKNTLIDKLDNLARKSDSHFERSSRSTSSDINERSLISPPILPSDYLSSQPVSSTPAAKSPGSKVSKVKMSSPQLLEEADGNATIITGDQPLNSTFNKESANSTFNQDVSSPTSTGLNSTFNKDEVQNFNSTFSKEGNATFNQTGNMNATFDLSREKNNSSIETPERIEEMTTEMDKECGSKARSPINCGEASKICMSVDTLNNSNDRKSHSCPASPVSQHGSVRQHGSEIQPKPVSRLGAASIKPQMSRIRPPPPSRLQAPTHMRYKAPLRSMGPPSTPLVTPGPPSTPLIPRGTHASSASGKVRSGLRPPMSVPRNVLKPPTAIPKSGLRLPAQVPGKPLRPPTIPTAKSGTNLRPPSSLRSPASVVESGLRKPSGIVRPSAVARPSGHARPTGVAIPGPSGLSRPTGVAIPGPSGLAKPSGVAIHAGARQGKTKQTASSNNDAPKRTGSGANGRLVTG